MKIFKPTDSTRQEIEVTLVSISHLSSNCSLNRDRQPINRSVNMLISSINNMKLCSKLRLGHILELEL